MLPCSAPRPRTSEEKGGPGRWRNVRRDLDDVFEDTGRPKTRVRSELWSPDTLSRPLDLSKIWVSGDVDGRDLRQERSFLCHSPWNLYVLGLPPTPPKRIHSCTTTVVETPLQRRSGTIRHRGATLRYPVGVGPRPGP